MDANNQGSTGSTDFPGFYLGFRFMPTFTFLNYEQVDNATIETTAQIGYGYGGVMGLLLVGG